MSGIKTSLFWFALVTPVKSNTIVSQSPVTVVKVFFSPLLLSALVSCSVLNMILVPIGASVHTLAEINFLVVKSRFESNTIPAPAQTWPPSLTSFAKFEVVLPVDWGAATASTVIAPPSNPTKSALTGLVSKSKGKSWLNPKVEIARIIKRVIFFIIRFVLS